VVVFDFIQFPGTCVPVQLLRQEIGRAGPVAFAAADTGHGAGIAGQVCPSHIPLVQYYRYAKTEIWAKQREKHKADIARERHEFHLLRMERKQREDEERKRRKKELLEKASGGDNDKQDAIRAAMERVQAKKAAQQQSQTDKQDESA